MLRPMFGGTVVLLVLAVSAQACGTPAGSPVNDVVSAQATNVRRTAVADVQKIIANNHTPTPQPEPTSTPTPSCKDAIWWMDARSHVGESKTVQGTIIATRQSPNGGKLLEVGQPFPDPTGLAILLSSDWAPAAPGKTVCAAGRISLIEGRATLQVRDATTIQVLN